MLGITIGHALLTRHLYLVVPKGFFPQQDTGRVNGNARASEDTSFQTMRQRLIDFMAIVKDLIQMWKLCRVG